MIAEAWASIDGELTAPVLIQGDQFYFQVPSDVSGTFPVEIWATDDAGNTSYLAGMLTLDEGTMKCFRLLTEHGLCTMLAFRPVCEPIMDRASCVMLPHVCPGLEVC